MKRTLMMKMKIRTMIGTMKMRMRMTDHIPGMRTTKMKMITITDHLRDMTMMKTMKITMMMKTMMKTMKKIGDLIHVTRIRKTAGMVSTGAEVMVKTDVVKAPEADNPGTADLPGPVRGSDVVLPPWIGKNYAGYQQKEAAPLTGEAGQTAALQAVLVDGQKIIHQAVPVHQRQMDQEEAGAEVISTEMRRDILPAAGMETSAVADHRLLVHPKAVRETDIPVVQDAAVMVEEAGPADRILQGKISYRSSPGRSVFLT
jgi:hypothetical protein